MLALLAACPRAEAHSPDGGGAVESTLSFDADRSGGIDIQSSAAVRAPFATPQVRRYLEAPEGSVERVGGEDLLSSGLGLLEPGMLGVDPDAVRVEDGDLIFESTQSGPSPEAPQADGFDQWFGPFHLTWDSGLVARTSKPHHSGARWTVVLDLDQTGFEHPEPAPTNIVRDGSGTVLTWRFPPGRARAIALELTPPWAARVTHSVVAGDWTEAWGVSYLLLGLLFLPVFYLLVRRFDELAGPGADAQMLRRQLRFFLLGAGFALGAVGLSILRFRLLFGDSGAYFALPTSLRLLIEVAPPLAATASAAAVFLAGGASGPRLYALAPLPLIGVVFALSMADPGSTALGVPLPDGKAWWIGVACLAAGALALLWFVDGLLRVFLSWLDDDRSPEAIARRNRAADLGGVIVSAGLVGASAWTYVDQGADLNLMAIGYVPNTLMNAIYVGAPLLSLAILPGAVRLLSSAGPGSPFLAQRSGMLALAIALYLFFVVPANGVLAGFAIPVPLLSAGVVLLVLAGMRLIRLERLEHELELRNPEAALDPPQGALLIEGRRELIDRALLIERLQRLRTGVHQKQSKRENGGADFVDYRQRLDQLDKAERFLQTGDPPDGTRPSRADRELVRLRHPQWPPILYPALGCGPGRDWKENGGIALGYGAVLAVLPLSYYVYLLVRHGFDSLFHPQYGLELLAVFGNLAGELAFWLIASYAFGCLFAWLPWGNGALKGLLLSLPVLVAVVLMTLCPVYVAPSDWVLRAFALLFFLSLLGLLMDLRTVRDANLRWRDLVELYQVRSVRFGIVNFAPLLIAGVGIYQQLHAGHPQAALEQAFHHLPQGGGGKAPRNRGTWWRRGRSAPRADRRLGWACGRFRSCRGGRRCGRRGLPGRRSCVRLRGGRGGRREAARSGGGCGCAPAARSGGWRRRRAPARPRP